MPDLGIGRGFAVGGDEKGEPVKTPGGHVLLFEGRDMTELEGRGRFGQPAGGIDLDEGIAGHEPIERGHLPIHGPDRILRGLEAEVFAQIALAVGLDLVLDQSDSLGLERLKLLGQHAIVARPDIDRRGLRSGETKNPFSGERHATQEQARRPSRGKAIRGWRALGSIGTATGLTATPTFNECVRNELRAVR
jgi:hypothetical protein